MNRFIRTSVAALALVCIVPASCTQPSSNALSLLPDIANFTIQAASSFVAGAASLISVASSSLAAGTYTVGFSLTGANNMSGLTATMTVSGGAGTFSTPGMPVSGETNVVITSISNSGGTSTFTSSPTYSISDSTGLMTATVNGVAFRATHVVATSAGMLSINGVRWNPLTSITLYVDNYANAPISIGFNASDASSFNGSAGYNLSSSSSVVADLSQHGTINITSVSPLLTGTFNYTCTDSTVVTGSFSCPAP